MKEPIAIVDMGWIVPKTLKLTLILGLSCLLFSTVCEGALNEGRACGIEEECPQTCDLLGEWQDLAIRTRTPTPRAYHTAVVVPEDHPHYGNSTALVLQGGGRAAGGFYAPQLFPLSDCYLFISQASPHMGWYRLGIDRLGSGFARIAHTGIATTCPGGDGFCVYYFGGYSMTQSDMVCNQSVIVYNDLLIFNISGPMHDWKGALYTVPSGTDTPAPRYGHGCAKIGSILYFFGGFGASGNIIDDGVVWALDTAQTTPAFSAIHPSGAAAFAFNLPAFAIHFSTAAGLYIYGGFDGKESYVTDANVYFVELEGGSSTWSVQTVCDTDTHSNHTLVPDFSCSHSVPIASAAFIRQNNALVMIGGSANESVFTSPFKGCGMRPTGSSTSGLRFLLYPVNQSETIVDATCRGTAAPASLRSLDGSTMNRLNGGAVMFGGMDPYLSGQTFDDLWILEQNEGSDTFCDDEWVSGSELGYGNREALRESTIGQTSVSGNITACRMVKCADYKDNTTCSNSAFLYCNWTTTHTCVDRASLRSNTSSEQDSLCATGYDIQNIYNAMAVCPQYTSETACESALERVCVWDDELLGIFQFGGEGSRTHSGGIMHAMHPEDAMSQWLYQPDANTWDFLHTAGARPTPRFDPVVAYLDQDNQIFLFGGKSYETKATPLVTFKDTWIGNVTAPEGVFQTRSIIWTQLTTTTSPSGRASSAVYVYNNIVYLFGGEGDDEGTFNDMWQLDLNQAQPQWIELTVKDKPPPRCKAAFTLVYINVTLESRGFATKSSSSSSTSSLNGGGATVCGGTGPLALVYGGRISGTNFTQASLITAGRDMWAFSILNKTWTRCGENYTIQSTEGTVEVEVVGSVGAVSGPIYPVRHNSVNLGQAMMVYGGITDSSDKYITSTSEGSLQGLPFTVERQSVYVFIPATNEWSRIRTTGLNNVAIRFAYNGVVIANGLHQSASTLLLFGGLESRYFRSLNVVRGTMLACATGHFYDNGTSLCVGCRVGTYHAQGSYRQSDGCTKCPSGLQTMTNHADSKAECNVCIPHTCSGVGTCLVSRDGTGQPDGTKCECRTCYEGEHCEVNMCARWIPIAFVIIIVVVGGVWYWTRSRKTTKKLFSEKYELMDNLLSTEDRAKTALIERDELIQAYDVDPSEVTRLEKIGEGTQGEVWKGRFHEEYVAIKMLAEQYRMLKREVGSMGVTDVTADIEREMAALMRMKHQNLVTFLGTGCWSDGTRFILLQYMARGSLRENLDDPGQEMKWAWKLQVLKDAANGMDYIHKLNRIHCDLKSPNLLVSASGTCKVADFGQITQESGEWEHAGSPLWIGPEVIQKEQRTKAIDVYAFGIIMWEVYTRNYPWDGLSLEQVFVAVCAGTRPTVPDEASYHERPKRYCDLMKRCWSHKVVDRPTFTEVNTTLQVLERSSLAPKPTHLLPTLAPKPKHLQS